ncbi:hypothetical protein GF343_03610 [Candidatus Woesearchaeota archaeon]|nr:hypothetical protein [Candidatus Woesearchaeota archaeon]
MELLITSAPVFIIIAIGALAKWLKIADDKWIDILNKFALYIGFPALIFTSLVSLESSAAIDYPLFLFNSLLLIAAFATIYIILNRLRVKKDIRNCYLMCAVFGNVAYFGFPYITPIIQDSGGMVSIIVASGLVLMFTMGLWVLENSRSKKASLAGTIKKIIKNPLLIAVILGVVFVHLNITPPQVLENSLSMLAKGASPVVLFALGIFLVRKIEYNKKLPHSVIITAIKLIALPAVFMAAGVYLFKETSYPIAVIEAGMPTALTWFALSQIYPMNKTIVVYTIIISTILSVITLPIITTLLL